MLCYSSEFGERESSASKFHAMGAHMGSFCSIRPIWVKIKIDGDSMLTVVRWIFRPGSGWPYSSTDACKDWCIVKVAFVDCIASTDQINTDLLEIVYLQQEYGYAC